MKKFLLVLAMICGFSMVYAENWWESDSSNVESPRKVAEMRAISLNSSNDYYYIITFEIKQSHFSLDITEHVKDSVNALTFEVPVDKEYYDSLSVGSVISDKFRMGSFIMKGSIGKWKIKVINKRAVPK